MRAYRQAARAPLALGAALVLLAGCMANPAVTVEPADRRGGSAAAAMHAGTIPPTHTVVRGENLYRIALQYGLDFRTIAALNGISEPYTIHPGDRLVLRASSPAAPVAPASRPPPAVARSPSAAAPLATPAPAARALPPPSPTVASAPVPAAPRGNAAALPDAPRTAGRWQAPVQGRAVRAYSDAHGGNKGVDVEAARGAPVWAAADGTVVYAGDGLKQYGNLIIVKHDEEYLSAYGHLERALVPEGTRVRKGQVIASVGGPGKDGLLHFEIRRRGEPVNPEALVGRLAR